MNRSNKSIVLFGFLLATLALILQFFEYRYFVGRLNSDIYTAVVATIFTVVGIWIGSNLLKQQKAKLKTKQAPQPVEASEKLKALKLNSREYEILQLIAQGLSNQEIADQLFIALPTVKTHTSKLYAKLEVRSRTQAVRKAQNWRLI